jgi:hypothetical protein
MRSTDQILRYLARRVGVGDHAAFRCFYGVLAPPTLASVRDDLPDPDQSMHVLRATFAEVWWMCAFDARCGTRRQNVARWVTAVAERHCGERRRALSLTVHGAPPTSETAFWAALLNDHDVRTRFQLAAMLDGHDSVRLPPRPRRPVERLERVWTVGAALAGRGNRDTAARGGR